MNQNAITEHVAELMTLYFVFGERATFDKLNAEWKKYFNAKNEIPETYHKDFAQFKEPPFFLDVARIHFKKNRGSWESEYAACHKCLTDLCDFIKQPVT